VGRSTGRRVGPGPNTTGATHSGVAAAAGVWTSPLHSAAAISMSPDEPPMSWPEGARSRLLAGRVGSAENPAVLRGQRRWPGYEPSPVPAAALAGGSRLSCSAGGSQQARRSLSPRSARRRRPSWTVYCTGRDGRCAPGARLHRIGTPGAVEFTARFGPRLRGYLVQPMAPAGPELLIGVTGDPAFGPLVTVGLVGRRWT